MRVPERRMTMDKKKLLFIFNPKAGKGKIRGNLVDILDVFARAGYEITIHPTASQGDARAAVVERVRGVYDLVVCSGGDGTLNEVVSGMMSCDTMLPIGYIPAGSTNDFARSAGISDNMVAAAENIVNGTGYYYDVGKFNNEYFVYIAAFGLFTEVSYGTDQDMKNLLGHMAYILEGVKSLSAIKSYKVKVETNGRVIEDEIILGMIANSTSIGGFKNITGTNVLLDDGEFEVTLIRRPTNLKEMQDLAMALVSGKMEAPCMYTFKTDRLSIETEQRVKWTVDGEFGGSHNKVEIVNVRHQLQMINRKK